MGIWNSHTSVGNILGSVLASCVLNFGWGWSFMAPALAVGLVGVLVFAFLVPHPRDLALEDADHGVEMNGSTDSVAVDDDRSSRSLNGKNSLVSEETGLLQTGLTDGKHCSSTEGEEKPIGFFEAWRLPSVASYAACLFFSKLVAYTFLYWLPFYIRHTGMSEGHASGSGFWHLFFDWCYLFWMLIVYLIT